MASITLRSVKGTPLTNAEVDANFSNLNTELGTKVDQAGARSSLSASGSLSYNSGTGVFSYTTPNSDGISEGSTNLYFSDARARGAISVTQNLSYNSTSGVITGPDLSSYLLSSTASSSYQPLDGDLTAIAALSGTSGFLRKTAANTWSLDTSAYLTANEQITISGDASGAGSTSISLTLANSGVTAGTYGSATNIPQIVVDAKGRITSVSNVAVSIPSGSLTFTGDVTGSGSTGSSTALTLANSGVTAGTYTNATVTVDAKGRVTSASSGAGGGGVSSFSAGTTGLTPNTATTGAITLAGTLEVANGGTGSTTASGARTNLGLGTAATMAGPSGTIVGTTDTQTLTNKTLTDPAIIGSITEDVFTISDGASVDINPGNGSIQLWTLGSNRTPTASNFASGESVTLMIDDGSGFSVTWTTIGVVWVGGTAPTLATTGRTVIQLWKVSTTVYGLHTGSA